MARHEFPHLLHKGVNDMTLSAALSSARFNPMTAPLSGHSEKPMSRFPAFDVPERGFNDFFNASSHCAVIKLMMHSFGPRPTDLFNEVRSRDEGYDVTMKDGFRLRLSKQEVQQAAAQSRFAGDDTDALDTAQFALAAFIKRKQLQGGNAADLPSFESVLAKSLNGETALNMLRGMGLSGRFKYVPVADVAAEGRTGVADSYDFGAALIHAGKAHQFGRQSPPGAGRYMFTLATDSAPAPPFIPAPVPAPVARFVEPKVKLSTTRTRPTASQVMQGFDAPLRVFNESFDLSSHTAVFKLMMLRFGRSPSDVFQKVEVTREGYTITMKDGFELRLSKQELARSTEASRFDGADAQMIADANFMLAAFVKRKQIEGDTPFEAALSSSLRGEHLYRVMKGMGLSGFLRIVSPDQLREPNSIGVTSPHHFAGSLVVDGVKHRNGDKEEAVAKDYGYRLAADVPVDPNAKPAHVSAAPIGVAPANIWSGFWQGAEGNCVTVSAIKAAMMKYGQNPSGIYKRITESPDGYTITMRDGCTVRLTHAELAAARVASRFHGMDEGLVEDAVFLYAASAKRAQLENHEFRAGTSFEAALKTLNDGEVHGDALHRLGLYAFVRPSSVEELASGVPGTLSNSRHAVAVVDGALDLYGFRHDLKSSSWMQNGVRAFKLV